ncbi:hypothetical protein DOY81_012168 [Sarcophaga bullata]|nr:hypothetical protein DOY81_012168 [Sarcophaga bullata]
MDIYRPPIIYSEIDPVFMRSPAATHLVNIQASHHKFVLNLLQNHRKHHHNKGQMNNGANE